MTRMCQTVRNAAAVVERCTDWRNQVETFKPSIRAS